MAEDLDFRILFIFLTVASKVSYTLKILQGSREGGGWLAKNSKQLVSSILGIFAYGQLNN